MLDDLPSTLCGASSLVVYYRAVPTTEKEPWGDGIYPQTGAVFVRKLYRHPAGEIFHRRLGRRVAYNPAQGFLRGHRGDVDDTPLRLCTPDHHLAEDLAREYGPEQIELEDVPQSLLG